MATFEELEARIAKLEAKPAVELDQLPLRDLTRWLGTRSDLLDEFAPGSITTAMLAGRAVTTVGQKVVLQVITGVVVTWGGGSVFTANTPVNHNLGVAPHVMLPVKTAAAGLTQNPLLTLNGVTNTFFNIAGETINGQIPLNGSTATSNVVVAAIL